MNVSVAINLLLALLTRSAVISGLIAQAQSQGRTSLTDDEWAGVLAADDSARAELKSAIEEKTRSG